MRYDKRIKFIKEDTRYNPDLGEHEAIITDETITIANATDLGTDRSMALFGDIMEGAQVVRTTPLFCVPIFDYVVIDDRKYKEVTNRRPLYRHSIIVKEVT